MNTVQKGWWNETAYGFILKNAQRLLQKPLKGQLNFFETEWPATKKLTEY